MSALRSTVIASLLFLSSSAVYAQSERSDVVLEVVVVEASADASAEGLFKPFVGG
jgi:iron complex outermembrane receptor protein